VIGDVHGRLDLLEAMFELIERDMVDAEAAATEIVLLGDLIDRGPHSKGVLARVLYAPPTFAKLHIIKGNHEEILVRGLSGEPELLPAWLGHGGLTCAASFGLPPQVFMGATVGQIEKLLRSVIDDYLIEFMRNFYDYIWFGEYLLVHAGVKPGVQLLEQGRNLRWIREEFLNSSAELGCTVVHGHTVEKDIAETNCRIGLDTGAYLTGTLSALRIEGFSRKRLQVRQSDLLTQLLF
jgi:serine/threonine protein phosphatase 1